MDISVSAIAGISRATRPVSSDTQIAVRQRRLEALDKQRAEAASSTDQTASYRLQALTQQIGLLQTQIAQLQQAAASTSASRQIDSATADEESADDSDKDTRVSRGYSAALSFGLDDDDAEDLSAAGQTLQARAAQRDAAAVARARAQGSLIGSNVDTYA